MIISIRRRAVGVKQGFIESLQLLAGERAGVAHGVTPVYPCSIGTFFLACNNDREIGRPRARDRERPAAVHAQTCYTDTRCNGGTMQASRLAKLYLASKGCRPSPEQLYTFRQWLYLRYERIRPLVQYTPNPVKPERLQRYWERTGKLLISTAHNRHPFWLPVENAMFRAVHDWDHLTYGHAYDFEGELGAYRSAASTAPFQIRWILWSEIVLQAAVTVTTGQFPRQKLVLAWPADPYTA